jgi:quinoprotein glucose dehydrogenase
MGLIFLLDRRTGAPLIPVEERPVPQNGVADERLSPTQPFQNIPALSPLSIGDLTSPAYNRSPPDIDLCHGQFAALRYDGIYTPPTLQGSLMFPGNVGGVNWGGTAIDPTTGILYANTNRDAFSARLVPRYGREHITSVVLDNLQNRRTWGLIALAVYILGCLFQRTLKPGRTVKTLFFLCLGIAFFIHYIDRLLPKPSPAHMPVLAHFGFELSEQRKSPYLIERHPIVDSHGISCTPAPWGGITAINLNTLTKVWEKPLGSLVPGQNTGILNFGGPIVTAGGLVFTAATDDPYLRIFDASTGDLLREIKLPAPGVATPMTYTLDGHQYVVIAAGGHGDGYSKLGDSLIAFSID